MSAAIVVVQNDQKGLDGASLLNGLLTVESWQSLLFVVEVLMRVCLSVTEK